MEGSHAVNSETGAPTMAAAPVQFVAVPQQGQQGQQAYYAQAPQYNAQGTYPGMQQQPHVQYSQPPPVYATQPPQQAYYPPPQQQQYNTTNGTGMEGQIQQPQGMPMQQPYYSGQPMPMYGQAPPPPMNQNLAAPMAMSVDQYGRPIAPQGYQMQAVPIAMQQQQRIPIGQPGHILRGYWSDGLCDCLSHCESCMTSWCISPYRFGQTAQRTGLETFGKAFVMYLIPWLIGLIFYMISDGESRAWCVYVAIVAHLIMAVLGCTYRRRIREKFTIPGDQCEDFCLHYCCSCCALAQEGRHADRDLGLIPPRV